MTTSFWQVWPAQKIAQAIKGHERNKTNIGYARVGGPGAQKIEQGKVGKRAHSYSKSSASFERTSGIGKNATRNGIDLIRFDQRATEMKTKAQRSEDEVNDNSRSKNDIGSGKADDQSDAFLDMPPPAFFSSPAEKKAVLPNMEEEKKKIIESSPRYLIAQQTSQSFTKRVFAFASSNKERMKRYFGIFLLVAVGGLALPIPQYRQFVSTSTTMVSKRVSIATDFVQNIVPESEKEIARHAAHEAEETGMQDALFLMITAIFCVFAVSKVPGGSPVVGFLLGGALIGPYATGIITHVSQVKVLAEFGVIFLLFNIGLELSYERLVSMAKYIFGMGAMQVIVSTLAIAAVGVSIGGLALPAALCVGIALAFSSTAVALQVLQDSGESQTRHGRATFSVLLFQDLSVVLVFMLVPLLAGPDASNVGAIALALCKAVLKTVIAVIGIIFAGRAVLRPIYNRIASISAEIMLALTLTCALGTALLTQSLGLSMALGAFLAGLLLAETEFHLQVEADIAPFRGLLLGLFFMTVGMTIDPRLLLSSPLEILAIVAFLIIGKLGVIFAIGPLFGVSRLNCLRSGLYIAPGGEFAFVTFAEAMRVGLLSTTLIAKVSLAVSISMAITPYLAILGQRIAEMKHVGTPQSTTIAAQVEGQVEELSGHVIIGGYARMGQIIGEVLTEAGVPFVALDTNAENVRLGRKEGAKVYFGDVASETVLHAVRADLASSVVLTTANEFAVATLRRQYPETDVYIRAKDVNSGLKLEKAGVKVVLDETFGPALMLAERILYKKANMTRGEVKARIARYRRKNGWQTMSFDEFELAEFEAEKTNK
jgi:monovalent cation:proton antiporter-2 (CPA2) family protein